MQALYQKPLEESKESPEKQLEKCFRLFVKSADEKEDIELQRRNPREKAFEYYRWLEYNPDRLKALVFDWDKGVPSPLGAVRQEIINRIGLTPTWVCYTDKGAHFGFLLRDVIRYDWEKAIDVARKIKKEITKRMGADANGSHKLKGWWRNPLLHSYLWDGGEYSLKDFYHILPERPTRKPRKPANIVNSEFQGDVTKRKIEAGNYEYIEGNRNNWLWRRAMLQTQHSLETDTDTLKEIIYNLIPTDADPLPGEEIANMARSIAKYNRQGKNFVSSFSPKDDWKPKNIGAMGFEPICKGVFVDEEKHREETKRRQREAAAYTNSKVDEMTRQENMRRVGKQKEECNRNNVLNLTTGMFADQEYRFKSSGLWNITKIAKTLGISKNTVTKHIEDLIRDGKIEKKKIVEIVRIDFD